MTKIVNIPKPLAKPIRERKPFGEKVGGSIIGYRTRGGTYVIAAAGWITDDGRPHDLLAIINNPFSTEHPADVEELRWNVSPELVAEVRRVLR